MILFNRIRMNAIILLKSTATFFYPIILWMGLTLKPDAPNAASLWSQRFGFLALMFALITASFNYLGFHQCMPLCMHKNIYIRLLGILLLDALILVFFSFLMNISLA